MVCGQEYEKINKDGFVGSCPQCGCTIYKEENGFYCSDLSDVCNLIENMKSLELWGIKDLSVDEMKTLLKFDNLKFRNIMNPFTDEKCDCSVHLSWIELTGEHVVSVIAPDENGYPIKICHWK